jgi:hypothetical protein
VLARKNITALHYPHERAKRHKQGLHYNDFSHVPNIAIVMNQSLGGVKK